ncbi:uncharacterized protein ACRADG_012731 [Cochliomyia hominivorax]
MSIYNEDELEAPSWINHEFLENVLQQYEKCEHIKINNFDITPASLKGDHYGSVMFRCKLNYNLNKSMGSIKRSFVIKTIPEEEGTKREMLGASGVFETEISMYKETLPLIEKILADNGEPTKLGAGLIYAALEPHKIIIMEDLCEAGYDTVRGRNLTEDEVKLIYKKIAKFHAVSYVLAKGENSQMVTKYDKGLFCNSTIIDMDLIRNGVPNFIKVLSKFTEFSLYVNKIKAMDSEILKGCIRLYKAYKVNPQQDDIYVLNHGDFHMKNLMFKRNKSEQLEDAIMVDYQMNCFAPSTLDTTYSQYLILSPELRMRKNEFMHYYFEEFIRVLKLLKYPGKLPLYSQFQIASYRYKELGLFLLTTFLPMFVGIILSKAEDLKDIDSTKLMEDVDKMLAVYDNPKYIEDMRRFLPILLTEGYLD